MLSDILHSPILFLHARREVNGVPCGREMCSARRDNCRLVTWGMRMLVDKLGLVSALETAVVAAVDVDEGGSDQ
jgi:hypothetical protein